MAPFHEKALEQLSLSTHVKSQVRKLVEGLHKRLGEKTFLSLCIYGSAARGEWRELSSDLNVLLVLSDVSFTHLDAIGEMMAQARKRARVVPLLTTPDEIRRASDVYCIKFDDIRRHHVCVWGEQNPLEDLQVDSGHLRFVCEFELRNIAMRMRTFFLQNHGQQRKEQALLMRFFTSSLFPLRALCGLLDLELSTATPDAIDVIGQALETDVDILHKLLATHDSGDTIPQAELTRSYERFNDLVLLAIERVDTLDEPA